VKAIDMMQLLSLDGGYHATAASNNTGTRIQIATKTNRRISSATNANDASYYLFFQEFLLLVRFPFPFALRGTLTYAVRRR
jgi:hypothetical protein